MKYRFLVAFAFLACGVRGQPLRVGDDIVAEYKKMVAPHFSSSPQLTNWAEGQSLFSVSAKEDVASIDHVLIALSDTTLIGALRMGEGPLFLFDTDHDSILDITADFFYMPAWVVKRKAKIRPADRKVLTLMDKIYQQNLQADNGEMDERTKTEYRRYMTDTTLANRHIIYMLDLYQTIITNAQSAHKLPPANVCIPLMKALSGDCLSLYGEIPPLVCIFMGEALQSAGMEENAREHFKKSLQFHPDSVPLLVYNYRLELDAARKQQLRKQLKARHPGHWMV